MVSKICRIGVLVFGLAYVAALALLAIGLFGLFGQERDPLSAVFLIPLGLPWNMHLDGFSDIARPWLMAATPLLNFIILTVLCRLFGASRRGEV